MPTPPDALDLFNLVETATVNAIKADPWLGNTANVVTVHEKIRRNADGDPQYDFELECPAIAVYCTGTVGEEEVTLGESEQTLSVTLDVVTFGGDLEEVDRQCKEVMSRLRRLIRIQSFVGEYDEATELDGFAQGEIVQLDPQTSFAVFFDEEHQFYTGEGATAFRVTHQGQE